MLSIVAITVCLSAGVVYGYTLPSANKASGSNINETVTKTTNVFLPKTAKDAVTLWAEALSQRNGAFRYAILTDDLKKQEHTMYAENHWVIGGSSPWVVSYKINEKNKIDDKTYEYTINYILSDSSKTSYSSSEDLTVKQLGSEWFVTKHDDYYFMPENQKVNSYTTLQPRLSDKDLFPRDKESTVRLWADALGERNGAFRFAVLDYTLKQNEYDKYAKMNWVIGGSSPRVVSYKINEKNKIDDKTSVYEIDYTLTDSTKALYYAAESITVSGTYDNWFVIKHDSYDYLPNVVEKSLK